MHMRQVREFDGKSRWVATCHTCGWCSVRYWTEDEAELAFKRHWHDNHQGSLF